MLLDMAGNSKGAQPAKAPAHAPGSKTVARHQGRDGNSGGPMGSSTPGGRAAQPANRQEARRPLGSRLSPDERGSGVTPREQRGAHAAARSTATPSTRRGGSAATTGVERLASRARREPPPRYTSLMHHFTGDNLRACFEALDGTKAPGVEGVTTARYGQHLEANLQALPQQLHRLASRPQPVRRVEIPKADGTLRPLGISGIEDKSVQELTRRLLDASDEPVFLDTSDGFRPGRRCHDALRQLNHEVMREPVNGRVARDLAQFVDTMPPTASLAVLAERIADQTFRRLIARLLTAGGPTPGGIVHDELGSPQGAIVSPVIAKAFVDHVLDQWVVGVVRQHGHGYCNLLRDADEALAVVETENEARRVLRVLPLRLGNFGLRLNIQKTHLVAFGKRRAWQVLRGGGRMPTVDFRGVTHDWGQSRSGKARLKRKPANKRLRRAVVELNQWLRQERNVRKRPDLWHAIARKMQGPFNYVGVTDNSRALDLFEGKVHHLAGKLIRAGVKVIAVDGIAAQGVSCPREVDIAFDWNGSVVDIECKRPQTQKALGKRLREACRKLTGQGIIAVDCSACIRPPEKLLGADSAEEAERFLAQSVEKVVTPVAKIHLGTAILGILVFARAPAMIREGDSLILSPRGNPFTYMRPDCVSTWLVISYSRSSNHDALRFVFERLRGAMNSS